VIVVVVLVVFIVVFIVVVEVVVVVYHNLGHSPKNNSPISKAVNDNGNYPYYYPANRMS